MDWNYALLKVLTFSSSYMLGLGLSWQYKLCSIVDLTAGGVAGSQEQITRYQKGLEDGKTQHINIGMSD